MSDFPDPETLREVDHIEDAEPPPDEARTEPPPPPPTVHHAELVAQGCVVRAKINELPFVELVGDDPAQAAYVAPPINPYLVGRENMLEVDVWPLVDAPVRASLLAARVEVAVRVFHKGDAVAPGTGEALAEADFGAELRARLEEVERDEDVVVPLTFYVPFDNDGPAFVDELETAAPYDDVEALRDYAMTLRGHVERGDASALVREMAPKIAAYARAYDEPEAPFRESLLAGLRDRMLPAGVRTDFTRDDVLVVPVCGGRIHELTRPNGEPLFVTAPDDEGASMHLRVLVAPRDGALAVVR